MGLGCWIALMNMVMTFSLQRLGKTQRSGTTSMNQVSIMINIFICQFFNSGILILVVFNSPFDSSNSTWFIRVGSALVYCQLAMLVLPYMLTLLERMQVFMMRCWDRSLSCDDKHTKHIIQSEYEQLYTGPEFILQVRYAHLLTTICITLSFSAAMPALYGVNFCILFV